MPKHTEHEPILLTIPQVAARLQVSTRTVCRWIRKKELISHRHKRWIRIHRDELERFLKLARDA